MTSVNFKSIIIIISAVSLILVTGFAVWIAVAGPMRKPAQQVKGAATSQEELVKELEQNIFGDAVKNKK